MSSRPNAFDRERGKTRRQRSRPSRASRVLQMPSSHSLPHGYSSPRALARRTPTRPRSATAHRPTRRTPRPPRTTRRPRAGWGCSTCRAASTRAPALPDSASQRRPPSDHQSRIARSRHPHEELVLAVRDEVARHQERPLQREPPALVAEEVVSRGDSHVGRAIAQVGDDPRIAEPPEREPERVALAERRLALDRRQAEAADALLDGRLEPDAPAISISTHSPTTTCSPSSSARASSTRRVSERMPCSGERCPREQRAEHERQRRPPFRRGRPLADGLGQPVALEVEQPLGGEEVLKRQVIEAGAAIAARQQEAGPGEQVLARLDRALEPRLRPGALVAVRLDHPVDLVVRRLGLRESRAASPSPAPVCMPWAITLSRLRTRSISVGSSA